MKKSTILLAAAVSGILAGALSGCMDDRSSSGTPSTAAPADKASCKGQNSCKGMGNCKTDAHACKGQNNCKGMGGCKS